MDDSVSSGETQLILLTLDKEEFACNIKVVREVLKMVKVTPLPRLPDFVEGVINLRGEVIPVIDLRSRFGLQEVERTADRRIINFEVDGRMVGLTVDSVSKVIRLPDKNIQDSPEKMAGAHTDLISGVGKVNGRLLIILDLKRILSAEEQAAFDCAAKTVRQDVQNAEN